MSNRCTDRASRRDLLARIAATSALGGCGLLRRPADEEPAPTTSLTPRPPRPGFHAGFNYAHLHRGGIGYGSEASHAQLIRLRALGVSHLALTPFGYLPELDGTVIRFGSQLDRSLTDDDLRREAAQAQALGFSVCLKPHLWSNAFWSGGKSRQDIEPPDWDPWFESYAKFAEHYAKLAEDIGASLYVVGLEYLKATTDNPGAWAMVAERCRASYGGALSYAANWWREVDAFADWSAYDYIGVNAYYPLEAGSDPSAAALAAAWQPHLDHLGGLARASGKPVLFLEAGLRAVAGATIRPWDQGLRGTASPGLQARAYEALLAASAERGWLEGIYWWKWFTDDESRERDDYSPMGMPAEIVISRWWGEQG
ncbi:MAG: hypothetical protein ACI8S6_004317 [Myxococcota bacterium]|jgi:hypothetical protein